MRSLLARVLIGGAIGAAVAAPVVWMGSPPAPDRQAMVVTATAVAGALGGWWFHRRYELPLVKVGRLVRYRRRDLEQWLQQRTVGNRASGPENLPAVI